MKILSLYLSDISLCNSKGEKIEYTEFVHIAKSKRIFRYLFRYQCVKIYCREYNNLPAPFLTLCVCRLMSRSKCQWINAKGEVKNVGFGRLLYMAIQFLKDMLTYKACIREISKDIDNLLILVKETKRVDLKKPPLYLRLDLTFGLVAGGSIGHVAGVVNNLKKYCKSPIFVSTDVVPTIDEDIKKYIINERIPYRNVNGLSAYVGNLITYPIIEKVIKYNEIGFIYQRSGLDIYSGVKASINYSLPYVLEYNGSEIWCEEHWRSNSLRFSELARKIERLTFEKADLITCVSAPLKEQLIDMGIQPEKIIVNPNGVNPNNYRPDIDGSKVREKYGINKSKIVIGFIGTFGAWHGAELLAKAYAEMSKQNNNIHLLMIGDGLKLSEVRGNLKEIESSRYTLTGLIPQEQGPLYLAACDILVNPTIPNADGTPFFGSPTKLFEYMAMGKAIVASGMDQMLEVLEHEKTALLVEPGNVDELMGELNRLIKSEKLRLDLGENARQEVCKKYTWEIHTKKIVDKLVEVMEI